MPVKIESGKFHGLMTGRDAERLVPLLVALGDEVAGAFAGRGQRRRAAGVELDEVDRLADVGIGLAPCLARLPDDQGRELVALCRASRLPP